MKRFYKEVAVTSERGVALDGKPVRTPGRAPLILPSDALADAVADEWRARGDTIDPRKMPLTGLANAAIDTVALDPATFAAGLASYAESDLLCYRAETPAELVARQVECWDPLLGWAAARYDIAFTVTAGIVHAAQPPRTIAVLAAATAACDPFELAALSPLVTIAGSLVAALALVERAFDAEAVWHAVTVDERWQSERWGADDLAARSLDARRAEIMAAARFLGLLG